MKRYFKAPRFRILLAYRGNSLGFSINRRWSKFHKICKTQFRKGPIVSSFIEELGKNGFAKIQEVDCADLSKAVEIEFLRMDSKELSTTLPESLAKFHAKDVYDILQTIAPNVEAFYGSYFQPYWIQFQRTVPGEVSAASAFGWHIDDNPKEIMKIFVYLNDVRESNGAFRAVTLSATKKILRSGFRSWSETHRLRSQSMVIKFIQNNPTVVSILEGSSGTCLIFDNNLIHKGTPPIAGYRHVIQIEVYPSMYPLRLIDVEKAITSKFIRDFPLDPQKNDFGGDYSNQQTN